MNEFKNFIIRYRGAIIGLIVAIILLALKIYRLALPKHRKQDLPKAIIYFETTS